MKYFLLGSHGKLTSGFELQVFFLEIDKKTKLFSSNSLSYSLASDFHLKFS